MDKKEFLDILGRSLDGEIDKSILEQNIRFYDGYISNQSDKSEEEVIKEIGDPRLIAKTIIETEKASYSKSTSDWGNYESDRNRGNYKSYAENNDHRSSNNKVYHLKWYHMLVMILILLLLFFFILRIGWILIKLFFVFLLPIIFITLLWSVFKRR